MRKNPGKYRKWYSVFCTILLIGSLLLSACASLPGDQKETQPTNSTEATKALDTTETTQPANTTPSADTTIPTNASEDPSLAIFRQAMVETPQLFAAAFFDYVPQDADPFAIMQEAAPQLCEDLPFLLTIREENIMGTFGYLFCIVPADENATVAVNRRPWNPETESYEEPEVLYRSESGEPILLLCNDSGWEPDTQVVITASDGTVAQWYPQITQMRCVDLPVNENGENLGWDFSPYAESLFRAYLKMSAEDWELPVREDLIGVTWGYTTWTPEGLELQYRLTFHEDVCSVTWNDSIDGVQHEFTDATWQLHQENGLAVLTIDFREFAGVLQYNLLLEREYEMLYVATDVSDGFVETGWESLYQYLQVVSTGSAPDPAGMIGQWGLSWTEVEGDYCPMLPDDMILEITQGSTTDYFIVSCTNNLRAESSFYDESTVVIPGEMYSGCGNSEWMAEVDYMDDLGTFYYITLLEDGTLLMQQLWYVDDAPMVSYLGFERAD